MMLITYISNSVYVPIPKNFSPMF